MNHYVEFDAYAPESAYIPDSDYVNNLQPVLPLDWRVLIGPFWTNVLPPCSIDRVQGWKIHISTIPDNAYLTLDKVAKICVLYGAAFKFASDKTILKRLISKNNSRESGGKFLTIYPTSDADFKLMLAELDSALDGLPGPYILSDRQYGSSKVVYYRYGGFKSVFKMYPDGSKKPCIYNRDFSLIEDKRLPVFYLPDFVKDDVSSNRALGLSRSSAGPLFDGKYKITAAIQFSNAGGVYIGEEIGIGRKVVIKEARPYIKVGASNVEAIDCLKKEYRLLGKLAGTKISPECLGIYSGWDHLFLIQEFVEGVSLRQFCARGNRLILAGVQTEEINNWLSQIVSISCSLIQKFSQLHSHGIVFGDLSFNNVIVDPDTLQLRLIDFEGAMELGVDPFLNIFTPCFGKKSRLDRCSIDYADDYYALGVLILHLLSQSAHAIDLKSDYVEIFLSALRDDINLPSNIVECILYLIRGDNISLGTCLEMLQKMPEIRAKAVPLEFHDVKKVYAFCEEAVADILYYQKNVLNLQAAERIFPVSANLLDALALDNGVLGIAYAWHKLTGAVPSELIDWLNCKFNPTSSLPGLLNGLSGFAWIFAELGMDEQAKKAIVAAQYHSILFDSMSLGYGLAGYGLSCLNLWYKWDDNACLEQAVMAAEVICNRAIRLGSGCCWQKPDKHDVVDIGLYSGSSGIALFLLYMYCVTSEKKYLELGKLGLEFDLEHGRESHGALGFPVKTGGGSSIYYPYLASGSAGVGTVLLRYYHVVGDEKYRYLLNKINQAASVKYTVQPGLFSGLAGLGNYLLDAFQFLGEKDLFYRACQASQGLKLFMVNRDYGLTFPLRNYGKVNSDYSEGAAGIGLFLNRLMSNGKNFNFMLDEILSMRV